MSLTKKDLIHEIAQGTDVAKSEVTKVLDHLAEVVMAQLAAGGELTLPGIGKLSTQERQARQGRNPITGESIQIPARTAVKFAVTKALKDAVA